MILFSIFIFISSVYLLRNPVYCILSFVAVVAHIVFLLISLETEYLAYVLAIVYIGAIVVLFLFVIMMFYIKQAPKSGIPIHFIVSSWLLSILASIFYFTWHFDTLFSYTDYIELLYTINDFTFIIAYYLFDKFNFLTLISAVLMLIGIIGSISLTLKPNLVNFFEEVRYRIKIWSTLRFKRPFQPHAKDVKEYNLKPRLPKFRKWSCSPYPGVPNQY